jgi:hypothetical protein
MRLFLCLFFVFDFSHVSVSLGSLFVKFLSYKFFLILVFICHPASFEGV